jgi:hypothetical protein
MYGRFLNSNITLNILIEYLENTHIAINAPRNTGTIKNYYPVISSTMMAGETVFVTDPETAAAPIIA